MLLAVLVAAFTTCLLVANIITVKLVAVGGWIVPAGVIAYPLTFLFTDVISELYGRKTAGRVVWIGFGASLLMLLLIYGARLLPEAAIWEGGAAYEAVLGMVPRVVLASMLAYLVSQHHDVVAFHFWRRVTGGRYLWLRNNASTVVSQALDTTIFVAVAFWGLVPPEVVWNLMLTQFLIKIGIAVLDTPLCYLMVSLLRRRVPPAGDDTVVSGQSPAG
jgi:queuosine precursor transporter